jgi:hypothetical protein
MGTKADFEILRSLHPPSPKFLEGSVIPGFSLKIGDLNLTHLLNSKEKTMGMPCEINTILKLKPSQDSQKNWNYQHDIKSLRKDTEFFLWMFPFFLWMRTGLLMLMLLSTDWFGRRIKQLLILKYEKYIVRPFQLNSL